MKRSGLFSIRRRVLASTVILLACAVFALAIFSNSYAKRASEGAFDRLLAASALTIANAVQVENGHITVELPFSAMAILPDQERIFYTIRSSSGLISGYDDLDSGLSLATSSTPLFITRDYLNQPVRMATVGRFVSGIKGSSSGWVTIRVAETLGTRQDLATELFSLSTLPLAIIMIVSIILTGIGIRRAFAPLLALEQELRLRSPNNLEPLKTAVPIEISSLASTLNEFMQRLSTAMAVLNNLVADAAHQIRTPLAALKMQSELALDDSDPAQLRDRVVRIHHNAAHTCQLVNQILMDATISHRLDTGTLSEVSIPGLTHEMLQRLDPDLKLALDVSITPSAERAVIRGDHVALREMLRNVVENALLYAPDSRVEIRVYCSMDGHVVFDVSDRGPGIPDHEKEQVLQRFSRGSTCGDRIGSGLGLSIVRSVAHAHNGTLSFRDRSAGGLTVRIQLPRLTAAKTSFSNIGSATTATIAVALLSTLCVLLSSQPAYASDDTFTTQRAVLNTEAQTSSYPAVPRIDTPVGSPNNTEHLTIAGPTDTKIFQLLIHDFQLAYPGVAVTYHEIESRALYKKAINAELTDVDVLVSSAVDLQIRLANDGYALRHQSAHATNMPGWAKWRNEVFGFTLEPAVIAYAPKRLPASEQPRSRADLLRLLERDTAKLRRRVGTYDINVSGLGYLFAIYDERTSSNFWGMANALGQVGVRLYGTTVEILDDLENGTLDIGYNVLGSYALARKAAGADLDIVIPEDYLLVFSRTALIAAKTKNPTLAGTFIDYLLSPRGQDIVAGPARLGALSGDAPTSWSPEFTGSQTIGVVQPVVLGPTLLVGLDPTRRNRFIQNWIRLVTDTPDITQNAMTGR